MQLGAGESGGALTGVTEATAAAFMLDIVRAATEVRLSGQAAQQPCGGKAHVADVHAPQGELSTAKVPAAIKASGLGAEAAASALTDVLWCVALPRAPLP